MASEKEVEKNRLIIFFLISGAVVLLPIGGFYYTWSQFGFVAALGFVIFGFPIIGATCAGSLWLLEGKGRRAQQPAAPSSVAGKRGTESSDSSIGVPGHEWGRESKVA